MSLPARSDASPRKVGLIAGGGALPLQLAETCAAEGAPFFVVALEGQASEALDAYPSIRLPIGRAGGIEKALRDAGCEAVVMAGRVARPDFRQIRPDFRGAQMLPRVLQAARRGDGALLSLLVEELERAGFAVIGVEEVVRGLLARTEVYGAVRPSEQAMSDIAHAAAIVDALGAHDVGQAAVVCDGLALAVEAAEGTDAMLQRVADLPDALRGSTTARAGILFKGPKPGQELRVDLPTVGPETMRRADRAGLAGVAVAAGAALIIRREETVALADRAGMFVMGVERERMKTST